MRLFEQTFQRANIKVAFTQGYNPKPVWSSSIRSRWASRESGDRWLTLSDSPEGLLDACRLNACAPEGFEFLDMKVFETDKRLTL